MAIITLTTDYGNKDYFTAAIKGAILSEAPEVQIIDISNQISPFNIQEGYFQVIAEPVSICVHDILEKS